MKPASMPTKIRADLIASGCTDEQLMNLLESEWLGLDIKNQPSDLAKFVIASGRDLGAIADHFCHTFGLSRKLSGSLAGQFANRVTFQTDLDRQLRLGISVAIWRHANYGRSPCDHASLDGRRFSIGKGIRFRGRRIFPGEDGWCGCTSMSVIPGLISDHPPEALIHRIKRFFGC